MSYLWTKKGQIVIVQAMTGENGMTEKTEGRFTDVGDIRQITTSVHFKLI
jgi:hypothetical protein